MKRFIAILIFGAGLLTCGTAAAQNNSTLVPREEERAIWQRANERVAAMKAALKAAKQAAAKAEQERVAAMKAAQQAKKQAAETAKQQTEQAEQERLATVKAAELQEKQQAEQARKQAQQEEQQRVAALKAAELEKQRAIELARRQAEQAERERIAAIKAAELLERQAAEEARRKAELEEQQRLAALKEAELAAIRKEQEQIAAIKAERKAAEEAARKAEQERAAQLKAAQKAADKAKRERIAEIKAERKAEERLIQAEKERTLASLKAAKETARQIQKERIAAIRSEEQADKQAFRRSERQYAASLKAKQQAADSTEQERIAAIVAERKAEQQRIEALRNPQTAEGETAELPKQQRIAAVKAERKAAELAARKAEQEHAASLKAAQRAAERTEQERIAAVKADRKPAEQAARQAEQQRIETAEKPARTNEAFAARHQPIEQPAGDRLQAVRHKRFDDVQRRNAWYEGVNAAGIRQDDESYSYAEIFGRKDCGGFTDYSDSDDSWTFGARTESIRHFDRISFAGRFEYDYFDGNNMCGSMFMQPGYYPVDILEFTPGRKVREDYAFTGALSAELAEHWTGGLRADFAAGNYAKRKDLRHKNKRLDFEIVPGILYHRDNWAVGAAYIFDKKSERVEAEEIGISAEPYEAFFDKGLAYGTLERWDGSGIHLNETGLSGFPVKELTHGVSLQGSWGPYYADVTYRHRSGETGEKDTHMHDFTTSQVTAHGVAAFRTARAMHTARLRFDWMSQENDEHMLRRESVNGIPTVFDLGSLPIFARRGLDLSGEYQLQQGRTDLRAGLVYERLSRRSTLLYPYFREQTLNAVTLFARACVSYMAWEFSGEADFRKGGFSEQARAEATPLTPSEYPLQLTDYYNYTNEYLTAPRLGIGVGARYYLNEFYFDLSTRYEHGFGLDFIPRAHRVGVQLSVGYIF
ncbi:MAG: hypothetical protein NC250_09020 [Alistipes senegalensis]|nr:hypothetical protein [Bacteroides cellulosilyticus]MCM1352854.1 hypothetical protein [Alistipes senegalensis]